MNGSTAVEAVQITIHALDTGEELWSCQSCTWRTPASEHAFRQHLRLHLDSGHVLNVQRTQGVQLRFAV